MARPAGFNSRCPLCDRYIVAKRSSIAALPEDMAHPAWMREWWGGEDDPDNGQPYSAYGFRRWVHEKCFERWANGTLDIEPVTKTALALTTEEKA